MLTYHDSKNVENPELDRPDITFELTDVVALFLSPRLRTLVLTALLVSLLLVSMHSANAADDLLDPGKIGSARKNVGTEGLLDPTHLGAKSVKSTTATGRRHSTDYARNMAASVVNSLDSLTRSAASLNDEIIKLDKNVRELAVKQKKLQDDMETKMEEYRSGLFCSGCSKTRSEILAIRGLNRYPISSFLFWELKPENRDKWQVYKFLEEAQDGGTHNQRTNTDGATNISLVLDGQQRLTSLIMGYDNDSCILGPQCSTH